MKSVPIEHGLRGSRRSRPPMQVDDAMGEPVGHLHDPLAYLAREVQLRLDLRCRTVWCDGRGRIFVAESDLFAPPTVHSIVGRYNGRTLTATIEADLRAALRERASRWIVDWNATAKQ